MARLSDAKLRHGKPGPGTGAQRILTDGPDGYGLYMRLRRRADGGVSKRFYQRVREGGCQAVPGGPVRGGKLNCRPIGPYPVVTLKRARETALANVQALADGRDPWAAPPAPAKTLADVWPMYRDVRDAQPRKKRWALSTRGQWVRTFTVHILPAFDGKHMAAIATADVQRFLDRLAGSPAIAKKARHYLSAVFRWAVARGHADGNPVERVEDVNTGLDTGGNVASVPYKKLPEVLARLRAAGTLWKGARLGIEWAVLTGCRPSEMCKATWADVDADRRTWSLPRDTRKTREPFRIPLSKRAQEILAEAASLPGYDPAGRIFPAMRGGSMDRTSVAKVLKHASVRSPGTLHGMRSSMRTWAAENGHDAELTDLAMGWRQGNVKRRYQRSDLLERRRDLMADWADYLERGW